jgi:hypothetical protein
MGVLDLDISAFRTALDMGPPADCHAIALGELLYERSEILRRRGKARKRKKDGDQFAAHRELLLDEKKIACFEKRS